MQRPIKLKIYNILRTKPFKCGLHQNRRKEKKTNFTSESWSPKHVMKQKEKKQRSS